MHDKKSKVIQIISIILCLSLLAGVSASDINTDWIDVNKVDSKKSNGHKQRLLLVRRKTVIVRMRSDRIVKSVNVSKKTVIKFT